jgi:hypothetical protein
MSWPTYIQPCELHQLNSAALHPITDGGVSEDPGVYEAARTSSTCGYAWPSVEYFADEYLSCSVGFDSSYPDEQVVTEWIHGALAEAEAQFGPEGMLYLQALLDSLVAETSDLFSHYEALHGLAWLWLHQDQWEMLTEENIADACDLMRAFMAAKQEEGVAA